MDKNRELNIIKSDFNDVLLTKLFLIFCVSLDLFLLIYGFYKFLYKIF